MKKHSVRRNIAAHDDVVDLPAVTQMYGLCWRHRNMPYFTEDDDNGWKPRRRITYAGILRTLFCVIGHLLQKSRPVQPRAAERHYSVTDFRNSIFDGGAYRHDDNVVACFLFAGDTERRDDGLLQRLSR